MNCYLCLRESHHGAQPAYACCQRCGAGMCASHLVELSKLPVVGPGGNGQPCVSLICCRCYQLASGITRLSAHPQQKKSVGATRWWHRFWSRHVRRPQLSKPEEAVILVEHFLKEQRSC